LNTLTKKEIDLVLAMGNSHIVPIDKLPRGITKIQAFLAIKPLLRGKLYWYALRNAYEMSDNTFDYRFDIRDSFLSEEPCREFLMNKSEQKQLENLPQKISIYRGMTIVEKDNKDFGLSWTLKKEKAEFFANKYQRNYSTKTYPKIVHEMVIDKSKVIAFFNNRKEFEIIYIHR
jgi:hypothetical protein